MSDAIAMCGIFFQDFSFFISEKKPHMSQDVCGSFDQICKISESPHTSYEHTFFFPIRKLGFKAQHVFHRQLAHLQTHTLLEKCQKQNTYPFHELKYTIR